MQERERLAHELHDTLAQSFAGVAFQLQGIRNGLEHADAAGIERANQQIDQACEVVRQTHEEASLSIAMLREEWPAGKELGAALEQCASSIVAGGISKLCGRGHRWPRRIWNVPAHIPVRVADALFHIGREAIVNSVRHADPKQIVLSVEYETKCLMLTVEDEGRGFDAGQQTRGFGLRGMEKRARSIGAQLTVTSRPRRRDASRGERAAGRAHEHAWAFGDVVEPGRAAVRWPRKGRVIAGRLGRQAGSPASSGRMRVDTFPISR